MNKVEFKKLFKGILEGTNRGFNSEIEWNVNKDLSKYERVYGDSNSYSCKKPYIHLSLRHMFDETNVFVEVPNGMGGRDSIQLLRFPKTNLTKYSNFELEFYKMGSKLFFCVKVDVEAVKYLSCPRNPRYTELYTARYIFGSNLSFKERIVTERYGFSDISLVENTLDFHHSIEGGQTGYFDESEFDENDLCNSEENVYKI